MQQNRIDWPTESSGMEEDASFHAIHNQVLQSRCVTGLVRLNSSSQVQVKLNVEIPKEGGTTVELDSEAA